VANGVCLTYGKTPLLNNSNRDVYVLLGCEYCYNMK
jgi:hypothetical protein